MKLFHVISTSILGAAIAFGVSFAVTNQKQNVLEANAASQTIDFTLSSASSVTKSGITVTFAKGSGSNAPAWYAAGLRLYASNTVSFSCSDGINAISINWEKQGSKDFATATANAGNYTHPTSAGEGKWSGSANSVVFTLGSSGQLQLNTFSVTINSSGGGETDNPIQALYSKNKGDTVSNIYGYFVGKLDDSNIVIMDGEYGIDIYKKNAFTSISYVENETIIKTSGSINIYNGLYEISATSVTTSSSSSISAPVVYTTQGGETADYANRVTTVTGVPTVTSGSLDSTPGTSDIKLNFAIGSKNVQVFYKSGRQKANDISLLKTAVTDKKSITVKGFTGWYNAFQVQMTEVVPEDTSYTAAVFAQDLLDQTDEVCTGWSEGDNNHDALVLIWSDLASSDKYPKLPNEQKTLLAEADIHGSTVIDRAMARYDFLTHKYNLNNFINGRLPSGSRITLINGNSYTNLIIICVSITSISALSFGLFLLIKKRKHS